MKKIYLYRSLTIETEKYTDECFMWKVKKADGEVIAGRDDDEAEETEHDAIEAAKEFINDWWTP